MRSFDLSVNPRKSWFLVNVAIAVAVVFLTSGTIGSVTLEPHSGSGASGSPFTTSLHPTAPPPTNMPCGCVCAHDCGGGGCSVSIYDFSMSVDGSTASFSWYVDGVTEGTMSQSFSYYSYPSGSTSHPSIGDSSGHYTVSLSGLTVPHVYGWSLSVSTSECGGAGTSGDLYTTSGGGGSCAQGTETPDFTYGAETATSLTYQWTDTVSSSTDTFSWGTTTAYGYGSFTPTGSGSSGVRTVALEELDPGTTYYFEIQVTAPAWGEYCYNSGTFTGQFTAEAASTEPAVFTGTVLDQSGNAAPAGMVVMGTCDPSDGSQGDSSLAFTEKVGGAYSLKPPKELVGNLVYEPCSGTYTIQLLNHYSYFNATTFGYSTGTQWTGHWNVTITAYGPGTVNFYSPINTLQYLPMAVDYMHNTNQAYFDYSTTAYLESTESWNFAGNGESTSAGDSCGWSEQAAAGANVFFQGAFYQTGTFVFDATHGRAVATSGLSYIATPGGCPWSISELTQNMPSDTVTAPPSTYTGPGCAAVEPGITIQALTVDGSQALTSGFDFSIGFSVGPSYGSAGASIEVSSTTSIESGKSSTLQIVFDDTGTGPEYFYYEITGGSNEYQDGMEAHVWQITSCTA
jgi:hypothetical protein